MIVYDEAWKWFKEGSFLGEVIENGYRLGPQVLRRLHHHFSILLDLRKFGKKAGM